MSSNIKVAIRVRPLISREKSEKLKEQWEVNKNSMYPLDLSSGKRNGDIYCFDHIFDSTCCNDDIYSTVVHPVVDKAMNGFNGTIFTYGQTSSGKTYTMMGNMNEDGLISLAVQNIFLAIEQSENRKFLLRVSYIEIYNEKIYDLLDIKNIVKVSEDYNGSVIVNVKEEVTDCAEKVYDIMKKGDKARRIGETSMNEKSSRSHAIFRIIIESSGINDTGVVNVAHLNLVDLAGSERATLTKATGQRLKEGAHINKSLSTLSLVMKQLSESQDFINFRDSKLTRILQPSLGGNALTAIICAVTPAALEETHSTLAFASRAKTVRNRPLLNEVMTDEALINKYALEINQLKRDLEMANDNRTLQAQKIALLEKCILFSKKTNNSNKNRRKTWSAPNDPNKTLPIIYETDVLRLSDRINSYTSINLKAEDNPTFTSENEKLLPLEILPGSNNLLGISGSKCISEKNNSPAKQSEDVVKWLINSTETPKSVLRERAEYYEHEFNSLKELTTQENILLTTEYSAEMETLKSELFYITNELEYEKREKLKRKEEELRFVYEKRMLQTQLDEMKKKNDELSKITRKLQKDNEQTNDCEFLVELYKEKYKKREKELLDSLQEARDMLKSNSNNTDDQKTQIICTDQSISLDMKVFLEEFKKQLNNFKSKLESEQPISEIQNIFNDIKKLNDEMLNNSSACKEELQDLLNVFKFIFDITSIVLLDDTSILKLEKEKRQLNNRVSYFQNKEKTYELLVSKQDEEIKHLSENILQYMNELTFHKNEVTKYKELAGLETSVLTDLDFSIMTNDAKNLTENDLNTSAVNHFELISKTDQCNQTEEDIFALYHSKDKEIEDLSDKIMEYIEQITSLEEELNKKSQTDAHDHIGFRETELNEIIKEYRNQIDIKDEQLSKYNADVDDKNNVIKSKDKDIKELTENINKYKAEEELKNMKLTNAQQLIEAKDEEITQQISQLNTVLENFNKYKSDFETEQKLIDIKNKEYEELSILVLKTKEDFHKLQSEIDIQDLNESKHYKIQELTLQLVTVTKQLSSVQEEFEKYKLNANAEKDSLEAKDKKIMELSEKVSFYIQQLSDTKENYEHNIEVGKRHIHLKENEIEELTSKVDEYTNKFITTKEEFEKYKTNIKDEKDLQCINNQKLKITLSRLEDELQKHILEIQEKLDLIQLKDNQISILNSKIIELSNKLFILTSELEKYKSDTVVHIDLIKSKDEEIQNVLLKLNAIEVESQQYKFELEEYKDLTRNNDVEIKNLIEQQTEFQNQICKLQSEINNFIQTNENFSGMIQSKDKEIEELSDKIMEYIEQITSLESINQLNKIKFDTNTDQCIKTNSIMQDVSQNEKDQIKDSNKNAEDYIKEVIKSEKFKDDRSLSYGEETETPTTTVELIDEKNKQICQLLEEISSYSNQFKMVTEDFEKYKLKVKTENELVDIKNKEIEDLQVELKIVSNDFEKYKSNVQTESRLIDVKNKEIEVLQVQLFEIVEESQKLQSKINITNELIQKKDEQIIELTKKVTSYMKQLSSNEENYVHSIELKINQIEIKDKEILDMTSKLCVLEDKLEKYKSLALTTTEIELKKHESQMEKDQDIITFQNSEMKNLIKQLTECKNQISAFEKEINILTSSLKTKEETIFQRENDIKILNKKLDQQLQELKQKNFISTTNISCQTDSLQERKNYLFHPETEKWNRKYTQVCSEYEKLDMKFKSEESQSLEYLNKIKTLEHQLLYFNEQENQMRKDYKLVQNANVQYTANIENLQKQVCALQSQATQQECILKEYKDYIKQIESEKYEVLDNNTTSILEIQKLTEELQEKSLYIQNLQKELVNIQSIEKNNKTEEITKLKKKNEDYKKIVEQVTEKANNKIESYNNAFVKLKQDNALMKVQINSEKESKQLLQNQLRVLREELEKRYTGLHSSSDIIKLQDKINNLEIHNMKLTKIVEDYQEQTHKKDHEFSVMKKSVESLKYENADLKRLTEDLNKKLCETAVFLRSARANVQLLEKEKENYNESARILEESLEDAKFELYELKNKEREKIKKVKRQSLHDSSRSLSSDEHLNIIDENQKMHLKSFESSKCDESKSYECERCNQRTPLLDKQIDVHHDKFTKIQSMNEKLLKKNDQLTGLCKIRKQKIDELERQIQSYRSQ